MRKKLFLLFFSFTLILGMAVPVHAEEEPPGELYAKSAVLMDADSGRVLYEKNGYDKLPMASTTKIMTCILALEEGNLDDVYEVSAYAASQPKVHMGVSAGEKYRLGDLLYSLMLESHNDAAVIIAEGISGSVEAFAAEMNQMAWELGCEDTYFITPNGLDQGDEKGVHSTTAADLARIMSYCIQNEKFLEITQTPSYTVTEVDGKRTISCNNHNTFLSMMSGAISGKTGFTGNAGYCYVGALQRDGKSYVVALLACGWPNNKGYKWKDTQALMNYGLENYAYRDVWEAVDLSPIPVVDGIPPSGDLAESTAVPIKLETEECTLPVLLREDETVEVSYEIKPSLQAPVNAGQRVGTITYRLNGDVIKTCCIVTAESVEKVDFSWCLRQVLGLFFAEAQ